MALTFSWTCWMITDPSMIMATAASYPGRHLIEKEGDNVSASAVFVFYFTVK